MEAMEHLCSRILHLDQGRVAGFGPPAAMIAEYLARTAEARGAVRTRALADGLRLESLRLSPNPVVSGDPLGFEITLSTPEPATVHDFHMVLNNPAGYRVALVDLRDPRGPYALVPGRQSVFSGSIARLPLVSGSYGVGFVLRTGREHQEFNDIFHLDVRSPPPRGSLVPYAVQYQGTTTLDYTIEARGVDIR
jgi:hypothetical protein